MNFTLIPSSQLSEGYCLIKTIDKKVTSKGSTFLDLILADSDGEINAKLWDYKEGPGMMFEKFDFVKVRGQFSEFNGVMQFRIDRIRKVTPSDNVNIDDYVPSACLSGEVMLAEIEKIISNFKDKELKLILTTVIDKYRDKLVYWPAARGLHHAIRGGLLMHTLTMLRIANNVCNIYAYVNYELLCAGIILHDIEKINEINAAESGIAGDYSVKGNLIGHLVMGSNELALLGKELGIKEETITLLQHMLISHHGVPEFGAAKLPMFIEALVLSEIDNFDAKMYEFASAVFDVEPGEFTGKQWALDNRILYNHGRNNDSDINLL